jgi:2-oxoglutarate ferredoxin oxidoreductase subunit beta
VLQRRTLAKRPNLLIGPPFHYCPGCSHGIVHRLLAEIIDEERIREQVIGVAPVGCAARFYMYLDIDMVKASHGRAPAVATGVRRQLPDKYVFTYQGDGDLLAIGLSEAIYAAIRGENILIIFLNNAIYGMTGGQIAPTTLIGQWSSTTPKGRNAEESGYPLRFPELIAELPGVAFAARCAVDSPTNIQRTKRTLRQAFSLQKEGAGFALVEILCACPTNLHLSAVEALSWLHQNMVPYYPLGYIKRPVRLR